MTTLAIMIALAMGPSAPQATLAWGALDGQTLRLRLINRYEIAETPEGKPIRAYSHVFEIDLVVQQKGPPVKMRGTFQSAELTAWADLLQETTRAKPRTGELEHQPDQLSRTVGSGLALTLGDSLDTSSTDSGLGMFQDTDALALAWPYLAVGFTAFPKGPVQVGQLFGEQRRSDADASMEGTNRVTAIQGDLVTVETTMTSKVHNLPKYMAELAEVVPTGMIDFRLNATTRFNVRAGRGESLTLKAVYPAKVDGTAGKITAYVRQEIQAEITPR